MSSHKESPASDERRLSVSYLSPTKSSQAKITVKPLHIAHKTSPSPTASEKATEDEDKGLKKSHRKLSIMGLGFATSTTSTTPSRTSPSPGRRRVAMEDTFNSSFSGCERHYRTRSPSSSSPNVSGGKDSPAMPGALPTTPILVHPAVRSPTPSLSAPPRFAGARARLADRLRKSVSGPSTPNPDEFGVNSSSEGDGAYAAKGTSSEEVEGMLVFDVGTTSGSTTASSTGASKASSRSSQAASGRVGAETGSAHASGSAGSKSRSRNKAESWASWNLDDLMASDGKLDVDAITAALGLSARLSRSSSMMDASGEGDGDDFSIEARSIRSANEDAEGNAEGRGDREDEKETSVDSLVRQHGSQLYPIIEEDFSSEGTPEGSIAGLPASASATAFVDEDLLTSSHTAGATPGRPVSYVVVGARPSQAPKTATSASGSDLSRLAVPSLTDLQKLNIPFLALPSSASGTARNSAASVSTTDLRGSVNESVLDFDLNQLNLTVPDFDFSGGFGEGVQEGVSLFGLGSEVGGVAPSPSKRRGDSPREDESFATSVGVAF